MGPIIVGGDCTGASPDGSAQRAENALDALLDELQTFSKPHPDTRSSSESSEPPAIPAKGVRPPQMSEIGRKGSMDSASFLPSNNLTVSTATGSLRRLHSYPSGSDTDNSPPIQPLQANKTVITASKPPLPERNADLLQHVAGKRIPPPPPPRTSSRSPLASPTSPRPPDGKTLSQFEQATQNLGLHTLRRNAPNRSSLKESDKSQTLPRNVGSSLQIPSSSDSEAISASSSCESVNSQEGKSSKTRKEELEQRHQELLRKQKALQEQYARLQQLQRGTNALTIVPPTSDQLLKKTGSESNLLQKMGLQMAPAQITGSLTNIPNNSANSSNNSDSGLSQSTTNRENKPNGETEAIPIQEGQKKVYETDIL